MKIIQLIDFEGTAFGLCDEGQMWKANSSLDPTTNTSTIYWELVEIPHFVRRDSDTYVKILQSNGLHLN